MTSSPEKGPATRWGSDEGSGWWAALRVDGTSMTHSSGWLGSRSETVSPPPSFSAGLRQAARDREASEGTIDMTPAIRRHGGTAHAVTAIQSVIAVTRAVQFPQLDGQGSYTNQRFSAPQTVRVTCGCSSSTSVATRRQGS